MIRISIGDSVSKMDQITDTITDRIEGSREIVSDGALQDGAGDGNVFFNNGVSYRRATNRTQNE